MKRFLKRKGSSLQILSAVCLLTLSSAAYSQLEPTLRFVPDNVDFGMLREEDGQAERKVNAINISADSTYIISAHTSCGCSGVKYSEGMLAPGDTAEVTITYDPTNRPGKFRKTVKLFTGSERIGNSIKLSGTVIPSKKNLDMAYPEKAGKLRLSTLLINAGEVSRKEVRPFFVGIYNDSDVAMPLTVKTDTESLEAALTPDTIEPFGISTLTLMMKGRNLPAGETDLVYNAYVLNSSTADTLFSIPVCGFINNK